MIKRIIHRHTKTGVLCGFPLRLAYIGIAHKTFDVSVRHVTIHSTREEWCEECYRRFEAFGPLRDLEDIAL